jgi:hypothetical protein
VAVIFTPANTGVAGRIGKVRAVQLMASDNSDCSTRIFIPAPACSSKPFSL